MNYQKAHDGSSSTLISTLETAYIPYHQYKEASLSKTSPNDDEKNPRVMKVQRLQRLNTTTGTVFSLISKFLTTALIITMAYVLYKFYTTKDIAAPQANRTSPWAKGTQLWPALMLAISSFLSLVAEIGEFIASSCGSRLKNGEKIESSFTTAGRVVWVVKWVTVAILYRIGRTTRDLWGWSCDRRADDVQQFYPELDFHQLCTVQVSASITRRYFKMCLLTFTRVQLGSCR